ncbi:MAG TPA: SDR family NAD(P)-dependent oxidoreductase [Candidatus Avipropionibacterium avicola]|uniref:SDR family NAD(P)-dependent oxidoreductase n=1 Tax=Candidatus Avipropionibacterium avicola TaxID=2840701 RepID=A0A9D1KKC9_9ACTN|nr:SDR family NAD(P)-dependent oxidoreductase [Candidatus Avipropionibacterium avicola]
MGSSLYRLHLGPGWRTAAPAAVRDRVAGRTVVVTGASSGIGRATAVALASAGAQVIGLARRSELLHDLADELRGLGSTAEMITCDLTRPEDVDRAVAVLAERPVDIVVSNAGLSLHRTVRASRDACRDLDRSVGTNLTGPAHLLVGLVEQMLRRPDAHWVHSGSVSALVPTRGWASYAGSKAGFDAWWRAVASELGGRDRHLWTSMIHFPLVQTPMSSPTYRTQWALTAEQAASVVLAALVRRPRTLAPWWARIAAAGQALAR